MKWLTLLVLVAFTGSLRADWRDELSVRRGKFPKPRAQTANYEIGWSGVKAAEAQVKALRGAAEGCAEARWGEPGCV